MADVPTEVVHKYKLGAGITVLDVPVSSRILHVAVQRGDVCIWMRHTVGDHFSVTWAFRLVGTGHEFPAGGDFIGTVLTDNAEFVFHIFAVAP